MQQIKFTVTHAASGTTVHVTVSPCSWMYQGYGLQIGMSTKPNACNAETQFECDKSLPAYGASESALLEMAQAFAARVVADKGVDYLHAKVAAWAQESAEWDKRLAQDRERERKATERRNAKMKADGYTHRIVGWIHPASGDDRQFEAYSKGEPTPADIAHLLKRSTVKNDYSVSAL